MKPVIFLSALLVFSGLPAQAGDFEKGVAAYRAGDYSSALAQWLPLAKQGNPLAQNFLGFLYDNGQGVLEDDTEAVKWYRFAAEQNHARAQYGLGVMFANGEGVPQSNIYAHMWWNLAAAKGDQQSSKNKDIIAKKMSLQAIAQAQQLARACISKNYRNCYKRKTSVVSKKSRKTTETTSKN
jgi:TPR repeat protein